ncbi:protein PHLOEM PROTEIN 2-LIKE A10-like [Nymphaea colorata]|nr:protein PHLOEM PROTEIN 2-LIKE A10-like [Nymphaea colorata]
MILYPLKDIRLTRRKKQAILVASAVVAAGYGAYRLYTSDSLSRKRRRLLSLARALISIAESASSAAETVSVVSDDLSAFLRSDSDQLPNSLKQISKIAVSPEFSESVARVTEALTIGFVRGLRNSEARADGEEVPVEGSSSASSLFDKVFDRLFSTAGSGFAAIVVGSFARSLVLAFYSDEGRAGGRREPDGAQMGLPIPDWVNVICGPKFREVIAGFIQVFVSSAVAVYLDKTMDINTYDEIFSGLTNPKHETKVKDMLISLCNGAVETLVTTSHRVLSRDSDKKDASSSGDSQRFSAVEDGHMGVNGELAFCNGVRSRPGEVQNDGGWVDKVSCTLAVPNNRRFLLDITGRVTFETVRSFLDFTLWKLGSGLRSGVAVVGTDRVESVKELLRYAGARSIVISTICLALCLHVLVGTKALTPV